jgi:hypothetical protein
MEVKTITHSYEYTSSDPQQYRYWSPNQPYASGDQLARILHEGWQLGEEIGVEDFWYGEGRQVTIFWALLFKNGQQLTMRVMNNPYVRHLLSDEQLGLKLQPIKRAEQVRFQVIKG